VKRSAIALVACTIVGVLGTAPDVGAQTVTDLDGFVANVRTALATLREPGTDPAQAIDAAQAELGLPVLVTLPDGSTVPVTDDSLFGSTDDGSDAATVIAMADRLETALAGAQEAGTKTPPDPAAVAAALAAAYGGVQPAAPSLVQRLIARVGQAIGWVLEHTLGALSRTPAGSVIGWILVLATIVGALLLVARVGSGVVPEARVARDGGELVLVDWQRVADEALASGDLNAAVPALYHVLVGTLASRGIVRDAPSLTSGECRGAVYVARPAVAPAIDRATAAFERVAYGKRDAQPDDVEALRSAQRAVRR
jgi:hypothetical protein